MLFYFKGHFQGQKGPIWTLWSIWDNISETVHDMTNVGMKHIFEVKNNNSIYFIIFKMLMTFKGHIKVPKLLRGCCS